MAEWKKVLVSGSDITQLNNNANYISNGDSGVYLTGSFTGSFTGDGSGLDGVIATNPFAISQGTGVVPFSYDGSATATVAVSGAAALSNNIITKWNSTDGKFVDSSLTDNGTAITGTTSIQLSGANSSLTGSFTGSFAGDGSGLTGLATNLDVSGSDGSSITIDLLTQDLTITGTANEIETSAAGTTLTIGLPDDVTITNDLTVQGDLLVNGTASFQNTENLLVADRFVLFASGSVSTGDGGIVVQQGTQNVGETFAYDSAATRWGFTSSFNAASSSFTPAVYVGAVQTGTGQTAASAAPIYGGASAGYGTIHVDTDDGEIWIYA
jgi:hypothetical protein